LSNRYKRQTLKNQMKVEKNNKRESAPLVAPLNSPINTLNRWKKKLIDHEQNRKLIVDAAQD
jgi:hypothetical protein